MNYQSVGSGAGVRQFTANTVDFGASDKPMKEAEIAKVDRGVLQIPGTEVVVDAASENSPFALPRCCALHANHSARPNARLELWPVPSWRLAFPRDQAPISGSWKAYQLRHLPLGAAGLAAASLDASAAGAERRGVASRGRASQPMKIPTEGGFLGR